MIVKNLATMQILFRYRSILRCLVLRF